MEQDQQQEGEGEDRKEKEKHSLSRGKKTQRRHEPKGNGKRRDAGQLSLSATPKMKKCWRNKDGNGVRSHVFSGTLVLLRVVCGAVRCDSTQCNATKSEQQRQCTQPHALLCSHERLSERARSPSLPPSPRLVFGVRSVRVGGLPCTSLSLRRSVAHFLVRPPR